MVFAGLFQDEVEGKPLSYVARDYLDAIRNGATPAQARALPRKGSGLGAALADLNRAKAARRRREAKESPRQQWERIKRRRVVA